MLWLRHHHRHRPRPQRRRRERQRSCRRGGGGPALLLLLAHEILLRHPRAVGSGGRAGSHQADAAPVGLGNDGGGRSSCFGGVFFFFCRRRVELLFRGRRSLSSLSLVRSLSPLSPLPHPTLFNFSSLSLHAQTHPRRRQLQAPGGAPRGGEEQPFLFRGVFFFFLYSTSRFRLM